MNPTSIKNFNYLFVTFRKLFMPFFTLTAISFSYDKKNFTEVNANNWPLNFHFLRAILISKVAFCHEQFCVITSRLKMEKQRRFEFATLWFKIFSLAFLLSSVFCAENHIFTFNKFFHVLFHIFLASLMSCESQRPITQIYCASLDTCVQRKMVKTDSIVSIANAHF